MFDSATTKKVCIRHNLTRNALLDKKKNVYGLLVNHPMLFLFSVQLEFKKIYRAHALCSGVTLVWYRCWHDNWFWLLYEDK